MSHVDEGALHAFLDGALDELPGDEGARVRDHLAGCRECALRLEEARALREEVSGILAGADPSLGELPPFEELRRQAKARAGSGSRWGGRSQRLAWAASIVLAVGAGWSLRQATAPGAPLQGALEGDARVLAPQLPIPASRRVDEPAASEVLSEVPEAEVVAREAEAPAEAAPQTSQEADAETKAMAPAIPPARSDSAGGRVGLPVTRELRSRVADERTSAERREVAREAQLSPTQPVAIDQLVSGFLVSESRDPDELDGRSATGSLAVPGLTVLSVSWSGEGAASGAVRVLQLLQNGDTLELLHLPAGAVPSLSDSPGDAGLAEVWVEGDGGWILARAPIGEGELRALVDRLLAAR